jgi:hypothetical protein
MSIESFLEVLLKSEEKTNKTFKNMLSIVPLSTISVKHKFADEIIALLSGYEVEITTSFFCSEEKKYQNITNIFYLKIDDGGDIFLESLKGNKHSFKKFELANINTVNGTIQISYTVLDKSLSNLVYPYLTEITELLNGNVIQIKFHNKVALQEWIDLRLSIYEGKYVLDIGGEGRVNFEILEYLYPLLKSTNNANEQCTELRLKTSTNDSYLH